MGDFKGALEDYSKAIEINPRFLDPIQSRGMLRSTLGDHKGALDDFSRVIELNPSSENCYLHRAFAKRDLGDYEGALSDFLEHRSLSPSDPDIECFINDTKLEIKIQLKDYQGVLI